MRLTHNILLPLTAAAAILLFSGTQASAQNRKELVVTLQEENSALRKQLDSLQSIVEHYRHQNGKHEETIARLREEANLREDSGNREVFTLGPEARDSISLWYAQDCIREMKEEKYNMDSVKLSSSISDDIYLERIKKMNNIFTLPYNDIVRNYIILYSEKRKSWMPTTLGLCSYYFPIFQEAFNRYGIPEELAALAIVETNLNPVAVSRAGARGMWQFMYAAAKSYGLKIDSYVDERLDVYKASDAAARYLLDAYNRFGDWSLAISSYNCGAGNVKRAIARNNGSTDYWGIYRYLPKETRGYVPAFVGALYITKYYREHGMNPKPCMLPEKIDTFVIRKKLHFTQLRDVVGIPVEEMRRLNPQYVHDIVPGNDQPYVLRMPQEYCDRYLEFEDSVYKYKTDSLFNPVVIKQIEESSAMWSGMGKIVYKVKSGDSLSKIASKYRCSVNDLKRWNNLKSTNIRVGQNLYIYKGGVSSKPATAPVSSAPAASVAKTTGPAEPSAQAVAPADTSAKEIAEPADTAATEVIAEPADTAEAEVIAEPADTAAAEVICEPADTAASESDSTIREITRHPELDRQPQAAAVTQKEYEEYTVRKGDTIYGISKMFKDVTADEIMSYNNIGSGIHPGDILRIPLKSSK